MEITSMRGHLTTMQTIIAVPYIVNNISCRAAQKCLAYVLKHQDQMVLDSALQMAEVLSKKIKGDSEEPNEGQNKEGGKGKDWFNAD